MEPTGSTESRIGKDAMKAAIDRALLPFAGLFATLPLYSPSIASLADRLQIGEGTMGCFALPLLATVLAVGLVLIACSKRAERTDIPTAARPIFSALYLGGFALLVFDALQGGEVQPWAKTAAGVVVGAGAAGLLLLWQRRFSRLGIRALLLNLALCCGVGSVCSLVLANLSGVPFFAAFFGLAALGSLGPLSRPRSGSSAMPDDDKLPPLRLEGGAFGTAARLGSIAGAPLGGLVMFGLIMSMRKFSLFGSYDIELVAGIVAAALAALVCLIPLRRPFFSFGYQEFLPACALGLMVCSSFPLGNPVQIASAMLMYVVFALVGLFALASLLAVVHAGEFSASLVMGIALAGYALASGAGVVLGQIIPEDYLGPILLATSSLYFAGLIMTAIISLAQNADTSAPPAKRASVANLLSQRCDQLGQQFSLSPREVEILGYLARGHNPTFVSRELVLSLSTVRTHIRNLYKKMGVGSQEELIALVDSSEVA